MSPSIIGELRKKTRVGARDETFRSRRAEGVPGGIDEQFTEAVVNNSAVRTSLSRGETFILLDTASYTDDRLDANTRHFSDTNILFLFISRKNISPEYRALEVFWNVTSSLLGSLHRVF